MSSLSLLWPFGRGAKRGKRCKEEAAAAAQIEELGVTPQLIDFVKGFTVDTFKNFPHQDDPSTDGDLNLSSGCNLSKDLSEWQERHAMFLLAHVKEISQIRYALCPRHLKDNQFWKIYFFLVKTYVAPYEIHVMQKAKLKRDSEKEDAPDKVAIEVEMMESNLRL